MPKYKTITKSILDGASISHTRHYKNDKEAREKNKGGYRLQIWKEINVNMTDNKKAWVGCCKKCRNKDIDFFKCYKGQSGFHCPKYQEA